MGTTPPSAKPGEAQGSVWSATWGNSPVRSELPVVKGGTCCTIVGTSEGYLAIENTIGISGYGYGWGVPTGLFYSKDGKVWTRVDHPAGDRAWIHDFVALKDGVLLESTITSNPNQFDEYSDVWISELDGSNWRKSELPERRESPNQPDQSTTLWRSAEFLPSVDGTRLGKSYLATNGDTAIWFGPNGTIERLRIEQ